MPARHDPFAALRHRGFAWYVASRFSSGTATTMLQASLFWQVHELSGSAFQLGLLGLVRFVPHFGLTLVGGAVADSGDRRRIAMCAQLVPLACGLALWQLTRTGAVSVPAIFTLVAVVAVAAAFEAPARAALLPGLVPRDVFPNAVTFSSTLHALAAVSGPGIGGLVIAAAGVEATYALHAALLAGSVTALAFVRARPVEGEPVGVTWRAIREGLVFVRRHRAVLGAMTLDMFAVIFGGAQALLPIYAVEILQVGPRGYGLLTASLEIGALAMAALLIALPPIRRVGRVLLLAVAAYGIATIAFGLSRWFPLSVAAYMAVGMADQVSVVSRNTLIQLSTPDALRGRVSSINTIFIGASNHLGAVEAGLVAGLTSATFAVVSGGAACLLVLGVVALKLPELRDHRIDAAPATHS